MPCTISKKNSSLFIDSQAMFAKYFRSDWKFAKARPSAEVFRCWGYCTEYLSEALMIDSENYLFALLRKHGFGPFKHLIETVTLQSAQKTTSRFNWKTQTEVGQRNGWRRNGLCYRFDAYFINKTTKNKFKLTGALSSCIWPSLSPLFHGEWIMYLSNSGGWVQSKT